MPPPHSEDKAINSDQAKLLLEVLNKTKVAEFTPQEWKEVADALGISTYKAAKERWRYLMRVLAGVPTRASKKDGSTEQPSTPKPGVKKAKKRKVDSNNEGAEDATTNEADDEMSAAQTPEVKKAKQSKIAFRPAKEAVQQENDESEGGDQGEDGLAMGSSVETTEPEVEEDFESLFEDGFGAIGGGEGSMFPGNDEFLEYGESLRK